MASLRLIVSVYTLWFLRITGPLVRELGRELRSPAAQLGTQETRAPSHCLVRFHAYLRPRVIGRPPAGTKNGSLGLARGTRLPIPQDVCVISSFLGEPCTGLQSFSTEHLFRLIAQPQMLELKRS
jgi:hypothetical protein